MALFDLDLSDLERYRPVLSEPDDFDEFWSRTLAESRAVAMAPRFDLVQTGLTLVDTYDVTFAGFAGEPIRGWLRLPAHRSGGPRPTVIEFVGYSGGRGHAHEPGQWALAGYANFVMDARGQGWGGLTTADTPDSVGVSLSVPGHMTAGITDPGDYYYRRVFTDAVLAIDAVRSHAEVDETQVLLTGPSQGGGIAIAAAALSSGVIGAMPDVPFLCNFPRATRLVDSRPYGEIVDYLKVHRGEADQVYRTLSYFDGALMARRAIMPALFSVALMDQVAPPSTVYSAYNAWACEDKTMLVYPFNEHEGGGADHRRLQLDWVRDLLEGRIKI